MCFKKDATIHALVVLSICSNYKARSQICGYPYKGAEVNLNLLGAEDRLCCAEIHQPTNAYCSFHQLAATDMRTHLLFLDRVATKFNSSSSSSSLLTMLQSQQS